MSHPQYARAARHVTAEAVTSTLMELLALRKM